MALCLLWMACCWFCCCCSHLLTPIPLSGPTALDAEVRSRLSQHGWSSKDVRMPYNVEAAAQVSPTASEALPEALPAALPFEALPDEVLPRESHCSTGRAASPHVCLRSSLWPLLAVAAAARCCCLLLAAAVCCSLFAARWC